MKINNIVSSFNIENSVETLPLFFLLLLFSIVYWKDGFSFMLTICLASL